MLLADLEVILKIAEHRSIKAAATQLDMQVATASSALKRVEKTLGTEIFVRTTRKLRLSSAGEHYIPQCEQAWALLHQAKQNIQGDLDIVDGEMRIALSSDLGRNTVSPWLDDFLDHHPKLSLRTKLSDNQVDFYRDSVDMALRYGSPNEASLYGFKICEAPCVLCASPDYVEKNGQPSHPDDLLEHTGLFNQLHEMTHDTWLFSKEEERFKIKMSGIRASNDGDQVRRWCVAGRGLAIKSCLDIAEDLHAGRLVSLMPEFKARRVELWLICPSRQSITPAVRLLRDMLREKSEATLISLQAKNLVEI